MSVALQNFRPFCVSSPKITFYLTSRTTHPLPDFWHEKYILIWYWSETSTCFHGNKLNFVPHLLRLLLTKRFFVRPCVRSKIPMTFYTLKTARSARHGSYSFKFCYFTRPTHGNHQVKSSHYAWGKILTAVLDLCCFESRGPLLRKYKGR